MLLGASDYPAILRAVEVLEIILVFNEVLSLGLIPFDVEPVQYALAEQYAVVVLLESHVINTSCVHREYLPVGLYFQSQFGTYIQSDHIQEPVQLSLAAIQYHHVIHIPVVVFHSQNLLDEVIQVGQVQVSQVLACEVSYGQPLVAAVAVNNRVQQPKHVRIRNGVAYYPFQLRMIHIVVELADVDFQTIPCPHPVRHQRPMHILHALVDSASLDTGIGLLDEDMLPVLTKHVNHIVVNDPVREERSNHQHPILRIVNHADSVLTRHIGLVVQHLPQLLQPLRDVLIEITDFIPVFLTFLGAILCPSQPVRVIEKVIEALEHRSLAFHQPPRALHINVTRHPVGVIYVVHPVGIAVPQSLGKIAVVPLAQIRAFNLLTHTDSTLAFFYQLSAVADRSCEVRSVDVC